MREKRENRNYYLKDRTEENQTSKMKDEVKFTKRDLFDKKGLGKKIQNSNQKRRNLVNQTSAIQISTNRAATQLKKTETTQSEVLVYYDTPYIYIY